MCPSIEAGMGAVRRGGLLTHKSGDDLVVYDPDSDIVHTLNATAQLIYECCNGRYDVQAIARELTEQFDVDEASAREDVVRILGELAALNLIQQVSPT